MIAIDLPTQYSLPRHERGFHCSGECSKQLPSTNDTRHSDDAEGYKSWLALGIEELGRDVAGEVESDWMVPLLVEEERDRLMAWQLGVSL